MIKKENIYVGACIIMNDPEHPEVGPVKGTVQKITELSNGNEYGYITNVLPDEEFRKLPDIKDNALYGLITCFGFDIDLLPKEEKTDKFPRQLQQFKIYIQREGSNGCTELKKCKTFYEDILELLDAYGYQINKLEFPGSCPEGRKGKNRIYCHPSQLAGECAPEAFEELKKMLYHGTTYKIVRGEKERKLVFDYSDEEEFEQYHLKYDATIRQRMLKAFHTDSSEEFKVTYKVMDELADKIKIVTIHNYMISGGDFANYRYLQSVYDTLLNEGKIVIGPKQANDEHITRSRAID